MKHIFYLLIAAMMLTLSACSNHEVRKNLGLDAQSPDEFKVVKRAPLEMPQSFELPKPTPGVSRPQETTPEVKAQQALIGVPQSNESSDTSPGEALLLQQAGADQVPTGIRATIIQENEDWLELNMPVVEKLGIVGRGEASGQLIDPYEEAERLTNEGIAEKVVKPLSPSLLSNETDQTDE